MKMNKHKGGKTMTTKQQFEAEEIAKRMSYKLNFLFQSLLDLNHEGLTEQETVLGLAFIIQQLQEETEKIREFFEKFLK